MLVAMAHRKLTGRGIKIRDHRGQLLSLFSVREFERDIRMEDPAFRAAVIKANGEQKAVPAHIFYLECAVYPVCTIGAACSLIMGLDDWGSRRSAVMLLAFGVFAAIAVALVLATRPTRIRALARVVGHLLVEGICPTCTYSMHGLAREEDGCKVCPECGGAWQSTCIVRGHDFRQGESGSNRKYRFWRETPAFRRRRVTDERGVYVPIAGRRMNWAIESAVNAEHREKIVLAKHALDRRSRPIRWLLVGITILFVGGFGVVRGYSGAPQIGFQWSAMPVIFAALPWCAHFYLGNWGITRRRTARELLVCRLCPSCLAELPSDLPAEDGILKCPECEAAWRMGALNQSEPADQGPVGLEGHPA